MNVFLYFIIVVGVLDVVGRAIRLYTGNTVITAGDTAFNLFFNLGVTLWAAYLVGGLP
jgi:hypothetical protein